MAVINKRSLELALDAQDIINNQLAKKPVDDGSIVKNIEIAGKEVSAPQLFFFLIRNMLDQDSRSAELDSEQKDKLANELSAYIPKTHKVLFLRIPENPGQILDQIVFNMMFERAFDSYIRDLDIFLAATQDGTLCQCDKCKKEDTVSPKSRNFAEMLIETLNKGL